jgi:hypothetical protein
VVYPQGMRDVGEAMAERAVERRGMRLTSGADWVERPRGVGCGLLSLFLLFSILDSNLNM